MKPSISRRRFMAAGMAATLRGQGAPRFFTPGEAALVEALCDQVIPADQDAGAKEAGVVHYIDRQLVGPLKRFAPRYRKGLAELDAECIRRAGKRFLDLPFRERTQFLKSQETPFFAMVVDHTMQGFYGSPQHGGNRGAVSWKMMGVEKHMARHGRAPGSGFAGGGQ